ncbi:CU044_2847 family protein [Edaphobacter paludis]|uniref:CU044_2847 family protein n=1 Tax=Edaphobacter paludis TaxID=3035702 RepID=A0AAU7D8R3_9BACT
MSVLARFTLSDGGFVLAEVDDSSPSTKTMRGGPAGTGLFVESTETFQTAIGQVKNAAEAMVDGLRSLVKPADELTLEFGVKLTAEAGAVIAKASTDAHFTVTLKWKSDDSVKS